MFVVALDSFKRCVHTRTWAGITFQSGDSLIHDGTFPTLRFLFCYPSNRRPSRDPLVMFCAAALNQELRFLSQKLAFVEMYISTLQREHLHLNWAVTIDGTLHRLRPRSSSCFVISFLSLRYVYAAFFLQFSRIKKQSRKIAAYVSFVVVKDHTCHSGSERLVNTVRSP